MTRAVPHRILSAWLAATFLVAVEGGAFGYHQRLHYGTSAAGPAPSSANTPGGDVATGPHHAARDRHGEASRSDRAGQHHSPASKDPAHNGPCTCVGSCHGSAAIPLAGTPAGISHALSSAEFFSLSMGRDDVLPKLLPYVLPYANGPPPS